MSAIGAGMGIIIKKLYMGKWEASLKEFRGGLKLVALSTGFEPVAPRFITLQLSLPSLVGCLCAGLSLHHTNSS